MTAWIDPHDSRSSWGRDPEESLPDRIQPTVERAHEVSLPFQYREQRSFDGTLSDVEVEGVEYTSGEYVVNAGVTGDRTLKLHVRGLLWRADDPGQARRFKLQLVRDGPPTETVPYGEYKIWQRYQFGHVTVDPIDGPSFEPNDDSKRTDRTVSPFGGLQKPLRLHISELELVRNPAFAKYRLTERDEWEEYGAVFRWRADAFESRIT
ncbi:hypothetical protein [Halobacterium jilantaiense]|uniref:Uncharacterized protein n=1 Tax=Halobacterium jilantaiense TaxID=355548 RepID=A0A1I0QSF6_9EURY|nr:hypothetical protein [Halobacterium jilantaiense]SEW30528.1 hypothetical protein SAMN04487945_2934 [Halobacterium jilantaiense]